VRHLAGWLAAASMVVGCVGCAGGPPRQEAILAARAWMLSNPDHALPGPGFLRVGKGPVMGLQAWREVAPDAARGVCTTRGCVWWTLELRGALAEACASTRLGAGPPLLGNYSCWELTFAEHQGSWVVSRAIKTATS